VLVWTNSCRSILDAVVFNGVPAAKLRSARDLRLSSGDWDEFTSRHDAALVGRNVARRRNLAVGEQFSIGEISVKVAGVFESSVPAEDNLIYTNLQFLQYTPGLNAAGLVTQHEVHLTDDAEPDAVARAIDEALRAGPVATTTRRKGAFQASTLADLVDLIGFAHWLGYACVALVLSLVATTTVMSVQDRVREHAVLQTLGLRPARVFPACDRRKPADVRHRRRVRDGSGLGCARVQRHRGRGRRGDDRLPPVLATWCPGHRGFAGRRRPCRSCSGVSSSPHADRQRAPGCLNSRSRTSPVASVSTFSLQSGYLPLFERPVLSR
jgi:hypothetical protein